MIKAYIIQSFPQGKFDTEYYEKHINKIKQENPTMVLLISLGEITVDYIFEFLFDGITDWLVENNVIMHVLWAGPTGVEFRPNIISEHTLGSAVGNMSCTNGMAEAAKEYPLVNTSHKLFTCYNNNAKPERLLLVDTLAKYDLLKDGIVTYRYPEINLPPFSWKYHDGSRLFDEEDYKISSKPEYGPAKMPKSYMHGFIDIVTETDCQEGYFIPTEKTAKPLGALKPFLVLSSKGYHQWMYDEYGIEKYDELFDYNFDNKSSIKDRVQGIVDNLIRLRKVFNDDPAFKQKVYKTIKRKLIENRHKSSTVIDILKTKKKAVPNLLKFILTEEHILCGEVINHAGSKHFLIDKEWLKKYV